MPIAVLLIVLLGFLMMCSSASGAEPGQESVSIEVDLGKVTHTMAGGVGACWHSMGPDVIHYPDLIGRDNRACKGSAYGGNPPVIPAYDQAWDDVLKHARWLGLDFMRVEFALDMFAPQRGQYSWDNDQMQTLYRILDHCQKNQVDVYLSMMWQGVAWNAHPGINRLQSSPKSVDDYADCYATLLDKLVKEKGFTCIRWATVNNEPGMAVGWWTGANGKPDNIMPAVRALRAQLDARGLKDIGLCGSDGHGIGAGGSQPEDPALHGLSIHCYWGKPAEMFKEGVELSRKLDKPFFVAEMGTFFMGEFEGENMAMGGPRSDAPRSYGHQLINAEKVIVGINMGVDGLIRWSFVNRGDLDGQWQMVRTWNPNLWDFKKRVEPEPVPYYTFGILTRFAAKHSHVLETRSSQEKFPVAALRSPKGELTLFFLNLTDKAAMAQVKLANLDQPLALHHYQVTETTVSAPVFRLMPTTRLEATPGNSTLQLNLPPKSITTCTTFDLAPEADGIIVE